MDGLDINEEKHEDAKPGMSQRMKNQIKSSLTEAVEGLKLMGGMTALETSVKKEISDPNIFPEVERTAEERKMRTGNAFAKYINVNPEEVHPDDIVVVAFGGSGGGFRAMIGCLGYCEEMKQTGLWDCLSYVSGVSGSCWSLAAYYTIGHASMANVIEHCKQRFSPYHALSGEAIRTILSAPGGARRTLGPLIWKSKSGLETVAMDLYSVLTTGWIFLQNDLASHPGGHAQKEVAGYQRSWYKWSSARVYLDTGAEPVPILTAIRHERPWEDWAEHERPFKDPDSAVGDRKEADNAWFQCLEITPYEVGCDETGAWVPTWAFGRPFSEGKSTMQLPEQSLELLLGLCVSAPTGPL